MGQTEVPDFHATARSEVGATRNEVVLARIKIGIGQLFHSRSFARTLPFPKSVDKSVDKVWRRRVFRIN